MKELVSTVGAGTVRDFIQAQTFYFFFQKYRVRFRSHQEAQSLQLRRQLASSQLIL